MRIVDLKPIGTLDVSAASGLVLVDGSIYVIADDLGAIHHYEMGTGPRRSGSDPDLPLPKAVKPDLEALTVLPDATLLALGSGSKPQRRRGVSLGLAARSMRTIDLDDLYAALDRSFPRLNIEGAVVSGDALLLAQRSNGRAPGDAIVSLDLALCLADLANGRLSARALRAITPVALGALDGVPLGFTDLATGPSGDLYFVAAAEATDDPYDDAPFSGSIVGGLDAQFRMTWSARLKPDHKVEGLHHWEGDTWLFVADADDPASRAPLLAGQIAPVLRSSS